MTNPQILIVEDDAVTAESIRRKLKGLGYGVPAVVASGEGVMRKVGELQPDLVLMDIKLKGEMNGVEAAEQIRAHFDIPVVYLTAYADEKTLQRARLTAPFGYLLKPFEDQELRVTLESALYRHRLDQQLKESEARYRSLFERVPIGLYRTTPEGQILDANPALAQMLGYDRESLLEINAADLYVDPEERQRFQALAERDGSVRDFKVQLRRLDGTIIWGRDNAQIVRDAEGQVLYYEGSLEDITERKQAAEALHESEQRFRQFFENAPDYCYMISPQAIILDVNKATLERLGYAKEEMVGQPLEMIYPPESLPKKELLFARWKETGQFRDEEMVVVTKGGEKRTVLLSVGAVRDKDGEIVHSVSIHRDITERKRAEEALRRQSEFLRTVIDSLAHPFYVIDTNDYTVQVANRIAGLDLLEDSTCYALTHRAPGPCGDMGYPCPLEEVKATKKPVVVEHIHRDVNGNTRFVEVHAHPILDSEGNVIQVIEYTLDITERVQAEQALKKERDFIAAILNTAGALIHVSDPHGRIVRWNRALEQMTGYTFDQVQARCFWDIFLLPEDVERVKDRFEKLMGGQALPPGESYWVTKDGRWRLISWSNTALRDEKGAVEYIIGVGIDVTERRQAEDALYESEKTLRAILNATADSVLMIDTTGTILALNTASANRLGKSANELLDSCGYDSLPSHIAQARKAYADQVIQSGEPVRFEDERQGIWFDNSFYPIFDAQGKVTRLVVFGRDITERVLAEKEIIRLNEDLNRRLKELAALNKAGQAIASTLDRDKVLQLVIAETKNLLNAEAASVLLCEFGRGELVFAAADSPASGELVGTRMPMTAGVAGWVAREGRPALVSEAASDPRFYSQIDAQTGLTTGSLLAAPLVVGDITIGVIEAVNPIGRTFSQHDLETLEAMAGSAAIAIANAWLFHAERDQRQLAETLSEVGAILVSTLDVNRVLDRILDQVGRVVPNDVSNIMLVESDQSHVVRSRGYERFEAQTFIETFVFPLSGTTIRRQMIETGQAVVVPDTHTDPRWTKMPRETTWLRSYAAAPIRVQDEVIGFLNVGSARPGFFDREHAGRLGAFANQAAIAFANAQLFEQTKQTAQRLEVLSRRLVEVQEAERRYVARELHDEIGQILTGLKLALVTTAHLPAEAIRESLAEAQTLVNDLVTRVRDLSLDLRPAMLDDLGLLPALLWHIERYTAQTNVQVAFQHALREGQRFEPEVETAAYRIVQEALTNVARHAGVDEVTVQVWATSEVLGVQIDDEGSGFEPETTLATGASSGLPGMHERASLLGGQLTVDSAPGAGTRLTAVFPLAQT